MDFELQINQKYIVQVDNFRITQDKVYRELIEIVDQYIKNNTTSLAKNIKKYYKSVIKLNTLDQSRYYADYFVNNIDELRKDKNNIWDLLGMINYNEIISWSSPFVWSLNPDDKNPKIYRCYIDGPKLSLNNINIYFDYKTNNYARNYKKRFLEYLEDLFTITFGKKHGHTVEDIFDCELQIINAYDCNTIKHEDPDNYNIVHKK